MPQPHIAAATADPQSYLRQAEVDGRRLRDVHDFTVRRHNKDEAVQRLKDQRGPLDRSHDLLINSLLTLPPSSRSRSIFTTLISCLEFHSNELFFFKIVYGGTRSFRRSQLGCWEGRRTQTSPQ